MDNASVWRARGPEIESHCWQEFFILKFPLVSRATQRDNAIANEINRGIHLAYTLFSHGNSMYLLVHLGFKEDAIIIWNRKNDIFSSFIMIKKSVLFVKLPHLLSLDYFLCYLYGILRHCNNPTLFAEIVPENAYRWGKPYGAICFTFQSRYVLLSNRTPRYFSFALLAVIVPVPITL